MVEDFVASKRMYAPEFTNLERLAHRCVEHPASRQLDGLPACGASVSGLRILKKNLARVGAGDRLQIAVRPRAERPRPRSLAL